MKCNIDSTRYVHKVFHMEKPPTNLQGFTIQLTDQRVSSLSKSNQLNDVYAGCILFLFCSSLPSPLSLLSPLTPSSYSPLLLY